MVGRPRSKRHPPYRLRCRPEEPFRLLHRLRLSRSLQQQQHRHLHRPYSIRRRLRANDANRNSCPLLHCDKQLAERLGLSLPSPVPGTQKNHYQFFYFSFLPRTSKFSYSFSLSYLFPISRSVLSSRIVFCLGRTRHDLLSSIEMRNSRFPIFLFFFSTSILHCYCDGEAFGCLNSGRSAPSSLSRRLEN